MANGQHSPGGGSSAMTSHAYTLAHVQAMAQLHSHSLMAAHAQHAAQSLRHGAGGVPPGAGMGGALLPSPLNTLMRKTLLPHKGLPGGGGGGPPDSRPPHLTHPHHPGGHLPYRSPPPHPLAPHPSAPPGDHNACSLIKYRDQQVAAFQVEGRELICLPQAFELFLKVGARLLP